MTRLPAPPRRCLPALALLACAPLTAQPVIPNPLVQPAAAAAAASAAAASGAPAAGAAAAGPAAGRGAPNPLTPQSRSGETSPLPPDAPAGGAEPPSIPLAVQERVSGLYVAAIVDRAAVLRSQIAVPQMMFSSGALQGGGVPVGGQGGAGQSGGAGGAAPAAAAGGGGGGGGTVFRSATYVVRDGQVVDFIDRYRVLARVTRDTVVLYLMADKPGEGDRNKVVFRGSIDSVIAAPPVPARGTLEAPDGGLDGKARRDLANVDARSGDARPGGAAAPGSPNASPGTPPR
jgi:hypothetical protein